ncbi:MAG: DUF1667 domain-containing protein [Eubacteriales bacterium]|nr:DUF1667 domain-containing protein [Eubacteriales bacterium]
MEKKEMVCIVCPRGCHIKVFQDEEQEWQVEDYGCKRGIEYGISEMTEPKRMLTTTVKVKGGIYPRIPVIGDKETSRAKLKDCLNILHHLELKAPIEAGEVLIANIGGTDTNILAAISMKERRTLHETQNG